MREPNSKSAGIQAPSAGRPGADLAGIRWGAWCGLGASITAFAGVLALILFYVIQVPHLHGGHAWGTDPGASMGYANDLLGIVSMALLAPFALALWAVLPGRDRTPDRAILALGLAGSVVIVLSGLGLVRRLGGSTLPLFE